MSDLTPIRDIIKSLDLTKEITPPNKREKQDMNLKEIFNRVEKDTPKRVIKKSRKTLKDFKFPIALIEFPLNKNDKSPIEIPYRDKIYIVKDLRSLYGSYEIRTIREHKPMDTKTLLATLYFTYRYENNNQFENKTFENKFTEWLDLLDLDDTGYYRKAIIEGLEYLVSSTLYHYHAWNYSTREREAFKKGDKLPSFSMFHILDEAHHLTKKDKGRSKLRVKIGDTFYDKIQDRYTYLELGKVLPLSDIALNLYMFIKKQYDKNTFVKIPYAFELLKEHIGITDKNKTYSRRTFDNAFKDLKDKGLIKEYDYKFEILDGTASISFTFIKGLTPVNNFKK